MADELSLFRVIVAGKCGELADLADIMQQGNAHQKIPLEEGIALAVEMAELGNAQSMLAEASDKAVVYGFGGGRKLECLDKLCIVYKKLLQKLLQPGVLNGVNKLQDRLEHIFDIALGNRQIVGGIIFSLVAESGTADIELQMTLEGDHFSGNIHIVHLTEFSDSHAVRVPDFGIDRAGFILKSQ